ncbi:MAG TPA: ABC transporter ATP-binding protein [Gaiellaceae bacterium]|nr:ABC transporter ATP-binding protein [Gaiellaceae bacterium]
MALLSVEHLTRRFGGVVALDDVSFDVPQGQILGLIGPNGAGKTTAFNVITRLYKPHSGRVLYDGEDLLNLAPHDIVRRGIARTFQNIALFSRMTVLENVLVGAHAQTSWLAEADGRRRALETLQLVGLEGLAGHPASDLPYPTLKRIELARALVSKPRLLLLDEPAGGLGHEEVAAFGDFLLKLRGQLDLTVLLVEHHMGLVMRVSETVHVLDFGRTIARGTPDEVRADPAVIEAYLGTEEEA